MRALAGAGALDRHGSADGSAGLGKRGDIFLPRTLVEVCGEKPTGLVFEKRVCTDNVPTLSVIDDDLVADGDEGLIHAVTALASSPKLAQSRFPFV